MPAELPVRLFRRPQDWSAWLGKNGPSVPGLWLRFAKKDSPLRSISYLEALEVALCHGWIDSQKKSESAAAWLQKFSPRSKKSLWSKINRDKALALIKAGHMRPPGLAEVTRAQTDGRWDAAYDSAKTATVPPDLAAAFAACPVAREFFATLNSANRYAVLWRIQTAKKPATRAERIQKLVALLARREKIHL